MKSGLTVSTEHWDRVDALRVPDVVHALATRPEKLYPPQKFTPTRPIRWDLSDVQQKDRTFDNIDDMLAAVRKWCG